MIVSHRHRFIFIKTHKTAGTSLEIALARFLGPEDVLAPDWPCDATGRRAPGDIPPQNYELPWSEHGLSEWAQVAARAVRTGTIRPRYKCRNHMRARDLRKRLGEQIWQSYTKFTVERNPWDKVVSRYYWKEKKRRKPFSFRRFVLSGRSARNTVDYPMYTINGQLAVDYVLFYEQLQQQLYQLSEKLGLPESIDLARKHVNAKSKDRPREASYVQHYTPELRDAVARQFKREIAAFGYDFEEPEHRKCPLEPQGRQVSRFWLGGQKSGCQENLSPR